MKWIFATLLLLMTMPATASIMHQGRHVVLLDMGLDAVYGSYWFSVENDTGKPAQVKFQVVLPKEVDDWRVQDGLKEDDIRLSDGALLVDKEFVPGTTVVAISFRAPAVLGKAQLTYVWPYPVSDFQVLAGTMGPAISSDQLMAGTDVDFSGRNFRRLSAAGLQVGETYIVKVDGILEGRGRLWLIGSVVAGLLLLIAGILTWVTRPKQKEIADPDLNF